MPVNIFRRLHSPRMMINPNKKTCGKIVPLMALFFLFFAIPAFAQTVEVGPPVKIESPRLNPIPLPDNLLPQINTSQSPTPTNLGNVSLSIANFSLTKNGTKAGDELAGAFTIKNDSSFDVYDVDYIIYFANKNRADLPYYTKSDFPATAASIHTFAGYSVNGAKIRIRNGNSATANFAFTIPPGIMNGDYILWVAAQEGRGQWILSREIPLKIKGSSKTSLTISDAYFVTRDSSGKIYYDSTAGLSAYEQNEPIKLLYQINSDLPTSTTLHPHIVIRSHSFAGPTAKEFDADSFILPRGEHSILISLPALGPGKYYGFLSFALQAKDSASQKPIDVTFPSFSRFSFAAKGNYAEIENAYAEPISSGGARVDVKVVGPSQLDTDIGNVTVNLKVTDLQKIQTVTQTQQVVSLTGFNGKNYEQNISFVTGGKQPIYPRYEISLARGSVGLDSYSIEPNGYPTMVSIPSYLENSSLLLVLIILAALLITVFWWRQKKSMMLKSLIFLVFFSVFFFGLNHSAKAWSIIGGSNSFGPAGGLVWGGTLCVDGPCTPTITPDNSVWAPSDVIPIHTYATNQWWGSGHGCEDLDRYNGSIIPSDAFVVISNGGPSNPNSLNWNNADAQFAGTKYYKARIGSTILQGDMAPCVSYYYLWTSGGIIVDTNQVPYGKVNMYIAQTYAGGTIFVMQIPITITPLSFAIGVDPVNRTVGLNQPAGYTVNIIPDQKTGFIPNQPAYIDYTAPYPLSRTEYWDSPPYVSEYKPGDPITFQGGSYSSSFRPDRSCGSGGSVTGYGASLAMAVISDGAPKDSSKLTIANVDYQFQGTNYRKLGLLNTTLQLGYNYDCTIWYRAQVWGTKNTPQNSAICSASGSLIPFSGIVNAYIVFQGDVGSFVAHQPIKITDNPAPGGRAFLTSVFQEPVNLSVSGSLNLCANDSDTTCGGGALDPSFYAVQFALSSTQFPDWFSNPQMTVNPDQTSRAYSPAVLKITPQTGTFVSCPDGTEDWGWICYDPNSDSYVGKELVYNVPPPSGRYKFVVQGVSGGNLPGIIKKTLDPYVTITNNPPPAPFDNLRIDTSASRGGLCPRVPLTWDATNFGSGNASQNKYVVTRLNTTIDNSQSGAGAFTTNSKTFTFDQNTTNFIDGTVLPNNYYTYYVDAYSQNGPTRSNLLSVRTIKCQSELADPVAIGIDDPGQPTTSNLTLSGTIMNTGAQDATSSFDNTFEINLNSTSFVNADVVLVAQPTIPSLKSGDSARVAAQWQNIKLGTHTIRLCADTPPSPGLTVADQLDKHNCLTKTITVTAPPLYVSCAPSPPTVLSGQVVTWTADVNGGIPPFTYSWSGDNGLTGSDSSVTKTYIISASPTSTAANKSAEVSVIDSVGTKANPYPASCSTLTVKPKPKYCEVNPADPTCQ